MKVTASVELVVAMIQADELELLKMGDKCPDYDPDLAMLWRKRRAHLQAELGMFRDYAKRLAMTTPDKPKPDHDPRLLELAEYFLIDEPDLRGHAHDLARYIQHAIDDWFELVRDEQEEKNRE